MRVGHLQPTRPEWFDRNPTIQQIYTSQIISGALVNTVFGSYTVPSGKKAYWDFSGITVFRTVAGTPQAAVLASAVLTAGAVGSRPVSVYSDVSSYGSVGDQWVGQCGILNPGDMLNHQIFISFTDGTLQLFLTSKFTEFDA